VVSISERNLQALAWEIITGDEPNIIEKYGGLNNASAYIGMMPSRKLGIVILANRGNVYSMKWVAGSCLKSRQP
jgi:beta-lactamase class C